MGPAGTIDQKWLPPWRYVMAVKINNIKSVLLPHCYSKRSVLLHRDIDLLEKIRRKSFLAIIHENFFLALKMIDQITANIIIAEDRPL